MNGIKSRIFLSLLFVALVSAGIHARADVSVVDLRCEYQTAPLGIDTKTPHLSWRMESEEMGQKQTAYRILVASSPEKLAGDRATFGTRARWFLTNLSTLLMTASRFLQKPNISGKCASGTRMVKAANGALLHPGQWVT